MTVPVLDTLLVVEFADVAATRFGEGYERHVFATFPVPRVDDLFLLGAGEVGDLAGLSVGGQNTADGTLTYAIIVEAKLGAGWSGSGDYGGLDASRCDRAGGLCDCAHYRHRSSPRGDSLLRGC